MDNEIINFDLESARLKSDDFAKNTATRVPICLIIDSSFSMRVENRMKKINEGVKRFIEDMKNDLYAVSSVELCIVTFGGEAKVVLPFTSVTKAEFREITPSGNTPIGEATNLAIQLIEKRIELYEERGVNKFVPWIVIFSDGIADDKSYKKYARELCRLQIENNWKVKAVELGANGTSLADFTPSRHVYKLKDIDVADFFEWISKSVSNISKSRPDINNYAAEITKFKGEII